MFTPTLPAWWTRFQPRWAPTFRRVNPARPAPLRPTLDQLAQQAETHLPRFVRESAAALKYLRLLGPLNWSHFPERPDQRFDPDSPPLAYATLAAAYLVQIEQKLTYAEDLRAYLAEHPALVWLLGFPLVPSAAFSWGFDVEATLPTHRHLSRLLRQLPNAALQFLLDETVRLIQIALREAVALDYRLGDCISLDTKHILAWVKQNNPKAYIHGKRFDKHQQPAGDPDCRLGCKRKRNQLAPGEKAAGALPRTPTTNPVPARNLQVGEYYWGYASGIVATKVPDWGEFVLAELTQPFDQPDVSYFDPLMAYIERRLGRRPRFGAFDAAFDAFYVYDYFAQAQGFAAVPFSERGKHARRSFSPEGLPLCAAGLAMPLKFAFVSRSTRVEHERGRYVCPQRFPQPTGERCPIQDAHWKKGGCITTMATSPGARLRYQLDRQSANYQEVYKQRTATERINSQAVELGIERPKLRNGASIANHNTLLYVLVNLHALQRIRQRLAEHQTQP